MLSGNIGAIIRLSGHIVKAEQTFIIAVAVVAVLLYLQRLGDISESGTRALINSSSPGARNNSIITAINHEGHLQHAG